MPSTIPPSHTEQAAIAQYEAMIIQQERKRRPGESGLMRALAVAWAIGKNEQGTKTGG
jgi:hypothetical protein